MAENTDHQPNTEVVRDLLSPYLDGEVTAQERTLVEQAVATSPELRDELESLRQTVALVSSLPQVRAPRPFTLTEAEVGIAPSARRSFFRLPSWASGLAAVAALLICVLAAGGLFLSGQFGGGLPQPAAEIAQFAAEAPAEEPRAEEAASPAEAQATAEVEQEIVVEKAAEAEAPAEPSMAKEMAEAEAVPAEEESTEDTATLVGAAESTPEVDVDRGTERAAAPDEVMLTATPAPMPTATIAAAMAAPAPELAEEQTVAEEGLASPPAGGEVPAAQPELAQKERDLRPVEIQNQVLRITPGLIYLAGTIDVDPGTRLLATIQRNGAPFDHWANPTTLRTVVQASGQFAFNIQAAVQADRDLFALEPASYQITITSTGPGIPVIALAFFDTFGPPTATTIPTATALPSPTPVARLTIVPTTPAPPGGETLGVVTATEEFPPRVGVVTGIVIVLGVGLLVVLGVVIWLVIRRVIRRRK